MPEDARWWEKRKQELVAIAREAGPIYVINEEALNETLFDLLSFEAVDEVLYPVALNVYPRMLDALGRIGAGFVCASAGDVAALGVSVPSRYGSRILLVGEEPMAAFFDPPDVSGAVAAVFDPEPVRRRPERYQDRETLVGILVCQACSDGPGPGPLVEALAGAGANVRGMYLPWSDGVSMNGVQSALNRWRKSLGRDAVLALGQGMGTAFDKATGRLDFERTAGNVSELRDAFGARAVWLVPGEHILSEIGALLVPVERVFRSGDRMCIQTQAGTGGTITGALHREKVPVWNLTGTGRGDATRMAVCGPGGPGDSTVWPAVVLAVPEPGDILLLPLCGFPGAISGVESPCSTQPDVCYLNARRICQVPL